MFVLEVDVLADEQRVIFDIFLRWKNTHIDIWYSTIIELQYCHCFCVGVECVGFTCYGLINVIDHVDSTGAKSIEIGILQYRVSDTCGSGDIFCDGRIRLLTYGIQPFLNWNIVTVSVLNVRDLFVTVSMKVIDRVDSTGAQYIDI